MSPEYLFAVTIVQENLRKAEERRRTSRAVARRRHRTPAPDLPGPSRRWRPARWARPHDVTA